MERTSGGETHIIKVAGGIEKGITFILQNLHSLSADQRSKFAGASQTHGLMLAHNLAGVLLRSKVVYGTVRFAMSLDRDTVSTFLLSSPQFLVSHSKLTQLLTR